MFAVPLPWPLGYMYLGAVPLATVVFWGAARRGRAALRVGRTHVFGSGNASAWGDYNTTRGLVPQGYLWVSAGWYMNGSTVVPFEVIYGRRRDLGSYNRWSGA